LPDCYSVESITPHIDSHPRDLEGFRAGSDTSCRGTIPGHDIVNSAGGSGTAEPKFRRGGTVAHNRGQVPPRGPSGHITLTADSELTKILVYDLKGDAFPDSGHVLHFPDVQQVRSIEAGSCDGWTMKAEDDTVPLGWNLSQNYPNPFNPVTTIVFTLRDATDWKLAIYNNLGQEVAGFKGHDPAGAMKVIWDAAGYASGVYFYRLLAGGFSATKKMVLLE
jgi:hypothetical protein